MMTVLINGIGLALIALVVWWFWLAKEKAVATGNSITIHVKNGVYSPSLIKARQGQALELIFIREDTTPCAEVVIFSELDINIELPLNQAHAITVPTDKVGEYEFCCQMGMYRGQVVVS
ncbi:MAG: cupredoxin domain-containing protein [Gammaproteobacteria bacterium]